MSTGVDLPVTPTQHAVSTAPHPLWRAGQQRADGRTSGPQLAISIWLVISLMWAVILFAFYAPTS
jgi:hypothetical protein